jgi:hypothetical protein
MLSTIIYDQALAVGPTHRCSIKIACYSNTDCSSTLRFEGSETDSILLPLYFVSFGHKDFLIPPHLKVSPTQNLYNNNPSPAAPDFWERLYFVFQLQLAMKLRQRNVHAGRTLTGSFLTVVLFGCLRFLKLGVRHRTYSVIL